MFTCAKLRAPTSLSVPETPSPLRPHESKTLCAPFPSLPPTPYIRSIVCPLPASPLQSPTSSSVSPFPPISLSDSLLLPICCPLPPLRFETFFLPMAQSLDCALFSISLPFPSPSSTPRASHFAPLVSSPQRSRPASWALRSFRRSSFAGPEAASLRGTTVPQAQTQVKDHSLPAESDEENAPKWWERDMGAVLKDVHSAQELEEMVASANGKLVVVEFFAGWCHSCRALFPKLCKLANEHEDVIFVKVNFDDSKALCKSLNVRVLPYFHFYQGALEQVDSFSCNISKLQRLKDAIARYSVSSNTEDSEARKSGSVN